MFLEVIWKVTSTRHIPDIFAIANIGFEKLFAPVLSNLHFWQFHS